MQNLSLDQLAEKVHGIALGLNELHSTMLWRQWDMCSTFLSDTSPPPYKKIKVCLIVLFGISSHRIVSYVLVP